VPKQSEHGRIIAAAAKAALLPIGCQRIGRSRCWISDQRCWVITVEFQPSAWAKGSYLNVTPHWLWLRYGAKDHHPRPADFIPFETAEQFEPLIKNMATIAARAVFDMRVRFRTLEKIHRFFAERISDNGFPLYRAAVTAGLVRDQVLARQLFKKIETLDPEIHGPWINTLKLECATFSALLGDPARYRSAITETITERRKDFCLPADLQSLE
jgi:hypothetical protein